VRGARLRRPTRADVLRATPIVAYALLLAWLIVRLHGLPASREVLVIVVLAGILAASATSIGRLRRLVVGIAFDWFPFVVMLALYDLIRGFADGLWLPIHSRPQIEVDRVLGLGAVPTVWLQQHLWHGGRDLQWYDYAAWITYASYFFVPTLVLAVLWWRSRAEFRRLAWMVVALAFAGCATYVLFPAVPPWLAGQEGLIPPVHHVIAVVSARTPVISFEPLWKRGTLYANDVAAIPSLHAAYTMLIALFLIDRTRSRRRARTRRRWSPARRARRSPRRCAASPRRSRASGRLAGWSASPSPWSTARRPGSRQASAAPTWSAAAR